MKNTYYLQKFETSLGNIVSQYVWSKDIEDGMWPKDVDGFVMTPYCEPIGQAPSVGKMSIEAVQADRKQRSTSHFKKDILPTLGKDEQRHFDNKYKK
jgi:hypothetical protein